MRKVLLLCSVMFWLFFVFADSPARAQMYEPINAIQLGVGYQYQHYNAFNRQFSDNGYNVDLYAHVVDWLTDPDWRITVGGEANSAFGFGGETNGIPRLSAKSLFVGAGPRVAFENRSRIDPWLHGLVGLQHFRFAQSSGGIGSNSSLGFMVGGGADIKLSEGIRWRVQADYIGSTFQSSEQSNFSVGTGLVLVF
jgi:opacity protein-like surface antigen